MFRKIAPIIGLLGLYSKTDVSSEGLSNQTDWIQKKD